MFDISETIKACNAIRSMIDKDVALADIVDVDTKLKMLTQLTGLSAEANASAKKLLHKKELYVLTVHKDAGLSPSILSHLIKAECFEELSLMEYCDRLNSALIHTIDGLRTSISLYKTELTSGLIPGQTNT